MPKLGRSDPQQRSQLNYLMPTGVTSAAPYGTNDTPKMKIKVVGGKLDMVMEDKQFTQREEIPNHIRVRPSPRGVDFNPDKINTYPMSLYGYKHEEGNGEQHTEHQEGQTSRSRAAFSPHRVVPPIHSYSTESFEENRKPKLERHLFRGLMLPKNSVTFTRDDELELRKRIQEELRDFDERRLKKVYDEITADYDSRFTGLVNYSDLCYIFGRNKVTLSDTTLALASAQYVEGSMRVNYEKTLSLIAGALKNEKRRSQNSRSPLREPRADGPKQTSYDPNSSPQAGVYYNPVLHEVEDYGATSNKFPFQDRANAPLLRYMEQQLVDSDNMLSMESIWEEFRKADPQHRGRLSQEQIKELSFFCNIPLQDHIINKILGRCEVSNGQYNWKQYLEFIEKVMPVKTGWNIPESKRPMDYARNVPEPSPNWPNPVDVSQSKESNFSPLPSKYVQPHRPQEADRSQSKQSQVDMLDSQIKNLERKYTRERERLEQMKDTSDRWFDRFMKLANAMYMNDRNSNGYLPRDSVEWLVNQYNDQYNLHLTPDLVKRAVRECSEGDRVMIDSVLKMLSLHHQK